MPNSPRDQAALDKTAQMIAELWKRSEPQVLQRLAILDAAASAAADATLTLPMREEACSLAHKLAGSLGMFGIPEGGTLALEMEHLLKSPEPDAARLMSLASRLRTVIFPADTPSTDRALPS